MFTVSENLCWSLTGKEIIELGRLAEDERFEFLLPDYVKTHVGNREIGFVDAAILPVREGTIGDRRGLCEEEEQMIAVANLTLRCIKDSPEHRPTMVEVAKEVRRIHRFNL